MSFTVVVSDMHAHHGGERMTFYRVRASGKGNAMQLIRLIKECRKLLHRTYLYVITWLKVYVKGTF